MKTSCKSYWFKFAIAVLATISLSVTSFADDGVANDKTESSREKLVREKRLSTIHKTQSAVEGFDSVELFDAMKNGEVEVVFRAKSAAESNLVVTNNTDRPLAIEMPAAFSAVPVMRQGLGLGGGMGGMGGGMGGMGGGGMGGMGGMGGQGIGGGMGGGMGGGGMGGMGGMGGGGMGGGGVFNIPAGKSGRLQLKTVCLEEGKPDPKSRMEYKIQPLSELNSDPRIFEMCRMLANDEISQPVAQAAAWNVTDGLSWAELLVKNRIERMDGSYERYFHPAHVQLATRVVAAAAERAELRAKAEKEYQSSVSQSGEEYSDANDQ